MFGSLMDSKKRIFSSRSIQNFLYEMTNQIVFEFLIKKTSQKTMSF
ncbi:hypothetical protein LEP1GSC191_0593 [Leptospira borgpetersenii serovar Mini str. 201000851]|uniref:Uncharacterized protein n=5 Tax=Leptospira borgpetersenii TaxID=174 RepID=M3HTI6_LEPBO|nr:hypothetical protein LBBP_00751 [Leptospira borgpetersenii serovar Ballum]EKR02084.1 hypothetical protein LEP1GSC121_1030 [Leptospira borgpetersenii serovar Castellonis str. 200801910]EMG01371.1 hypothetical protein LEP1GSC123_3752 [Leptospira borgpetersenii str. 200701203]EMK12498.1 hypothetical protein LEP1GSC066_1365 [Leptospira sp. serovar Kenya str. Sh9]EMN12443.1 hypothetical protein LEP1GSC055_1453 [Leptospira borgpetersenii str. Brem 307]EMN59149.1 hypothetical protein LEP1GSC090_18